ncbi:MAG: hypothetical protein KAH10_08150 [Flavobacteriales bacterium]|nr:hypothetical protein [Flavobacteriales bacterium]
MKKILILLLFTTQFACAQNSNKELNKFFYQLERSGAMNAFKHDIKVSKTFEEQSVLTPTEFMIESHALVDVSSGAILVLKDGEGRKRILQVIGSKGETLGVYSEEGEYEIEVLDEQKFIYIFMRTEYNPNIPNDKQKAISVARTTRVISDAQGAFIGRK